MQAEIASPSAMTSDFATVAVSMVVVKDTRQQTLVNNTTYETLEQTLADDMMHETLEQLFKLTVQETHEQTLINHTMQQTLE
jgi:hypothetical protein